MIERISIKMLKEWLNQFPAVGIIGPRQVGKTTLAKQLIHDRADAIYLDLESQEDLSKLTEPSLFLRNYASHCIVLDEIQRKPELFPILRSLIDEDRRPGRFIILGSASPSLLRQSSESLAGRIAYHELTPFNVAETGRENINRLWIRGGFPDSYLAESNDKSFLWRNQFLQTYAERDLPMLGLTIEKQTIMNFQRMVAHSQGQIWNAQNFSKSLGISATTARRYLNFLNKAFLVDILEPFHANIKKRLVKAPKTYYKDTGLMHALLRIPGFHDLAGHPLLGVSWEGFVIQQIKAKFMDHFEYNYFRSHQGAEADLVLSKGNSVICTIEIKYSNAPKVSRGFLNVINDLKSDRNFIITPASEHFPIHKKIEVISLGDFLSLEI